MTKKYTLFEYKFDGEVTETSNDPEYVLGIYTRTISNAEMNSNKSNEPGGWWKPVLEDCVAWLRRNFKKDYFNFGEWTVIGLLDDESWPIVQRQPPVLTFGGFKKSEGF